MRIVMTGATSGFGRHAAEKLIVDECHQLILGTRRERSDIPSSLKFEEVRFLPLDLADLASVRSFAQRVGEEPIDALVLNAGLQTGAPRRAPNGMELTFVANHLAHFALLQLLLPRLARGGRVVITSSGTHDPDQKTGVPAPDHADVERLAYPERDDTTPRIERLESLRAYSSSKLLNVMTAMEMADRYPKVTTLAFDPAFVPETGLSRDAPGWMRVMLNKVLPLIMPAKAKSTVGNSGRLLYELITGPRFTTLEEVYWTVNGSRAEAIAPSDLARNAAARRRMWDDSLRLAGVEPPARTGGRLSETAAR